MNASDIPEARCPYCGCLPYRREDWQPTEVASLRQWWSGGLTSGQIVRKFGGKYSRSAVLGKIGRLGIQRKNSGQTVSRGPI